MIPLSWRNSGRRRQRDGGNPCCPGATSGTPKMYFSVYIFGLLFFSFYPSKGSSFSAPTTSVADPHHFNADPDPSFRVDVDPDLTCHLNADPDPALNQRSANPNTGLQTFQGSVLSLLCECPWPSNVDPDPAFYSNADADPFSQNNGDPCESGSATVCTTLL
jgi:hypothetical protein